MEFSRLIWSTLLIASFCLLIGTEGIFNGIQLKNSDLKNFKYLVAIKIEMGDFNQMCGGAILDDFMILSAAHCFYDQKDKKFYDKVTVRANVLEHKKPYIFGIEKTVEKIFIPKSYEKRGNDDDIAIIKVSKTLNLANNSQKIQAIVLPTSKTATDDKKAIIAGYGAHRFDNGDPFSDRKLRSLDVKIVTKSKCIRKKAKASLSPGKYICAEPVEKDQPRGFCNGDSGGPLVIRNGNLAEIVGVIAENDPKCDDRENYGLYMRVANYLGFIEKVMKHKVDTEIIVKEYKSQSIFG